MEYPHLTPDKKQHIDVVVDFLSKRYKDEDNQIDWTQLFEEFHIKYIEDDIFPIPSAIKKNGKQFVVGPECTSKKMRTYINGHELGHLVLGHNDSLPTEIKENEADYFSIQLSEYCPNILKMIYEVIKITFLSPTIDLYLKDEELYWNDPEVIKALNGEK